MNTEAIGRAVHATARAFHPAAYIFIPVLQIKDRFDGRPMGKKMERTLQTYCTPEQRQNRAYMRKLRRDMWYSFILYSCPFDEYFLFDFPRLSYRGRREFVTEEEKKYLCHRLSPESTREIFWNKWSTYEHFHAFYKRELIKVDKNSSEEDFYRFIKAHPQYIVKPCDDSCGNGVFIIDMENNRQNAKELLAQFRKTDVVLEELIVQAEEMSRLHPESVNTVRCATFVKDGLPSILFTFLRIGQGSSIVDNGGAGGFVASVDMETGIVITPGITETRRAFLIHPDTGAQIIGMRIPKWQELKQMALQLAMVIPEQQYVSWDLALTNCGWVMVEGNSAGQFIGPQFTTGYGIRKTLSNYFDLHY